MLFSVIIPTCNRNDALKKCMECIHPSRQSLSAEMYEVIVSDDSSDMSAVNFLYKNENWASWVKGPQKGPAANRNNGARYAKGEWLIFIDDDCVPGKNLLNEYDKAIKNNPDYLAFEGAIFPDDEKLLKKDLAECPVNTEGGCFWSANICVQKKLFDDIGGFNEQFLIAAQEDQQLKFDIENTTTQKIFFVEKAIVTHPVRIMALKEKLLQVPGASKNYCIYAYRNKKNLGYTSLYKFIKGQYYLNLKQMFISFKHLKPKRFIMGFINLFYMVPLNIFNFYKLSHLSNQKTGNV